MSFLITLVAFLLILGVLVFVHELGHFAVAKWTGMRVDEFAVGFPPRIWKRRKGETQYVIGAVPFGGYVKIHGENPVEGEHDEDPRSFEKQSVWARMAVVLAGVTMNLLFAFVALVIAFSVGFSSIAQDLESIPGAVVKHAEVLVSDVQEGGGAAVAGIERGDVLESLTAAGETKHISSLTELIDVTKAYQANGVTDVTVAYRRGGEEKTTVAKIAPTGAPLGVYIQSLATVRVPFWRAPEVAVKEMGAIVGLTWDALKGFGRRLVLQAQLDPNVSGPVGIYQATGAATQAGVIPTVFLVVALSINLALLNILPIPALDGGKFIFLAIEAVTRRKLNRRFESAITFAGFVLLMGLILILSVRDVIRLF